MNIGIDKNMKRLSTVLKSRGFQVTEIDYITAAATSQVEITANSRLNPKKLDVINKKIDIYIYYEDAFHAKYYNDFQNNMLNSFIPNEEGALLINASNKTVEQIISIIETGVYSPLFTENTSLLF